jgi:hypothetical protein
LVGHSANNAIALFHSLLPFQVRGFNMIDTLCPVQFQPLWFDLTGLALLGVGVWLFTRLAPIDPAKGVLQKVPVQG